MALRFHAVVDAIVVGAGPAGAVTAALMARRGLDVALVDKARFPRDKVCGDFIGPHAVRELEELGLAATLEPGNRVGSGIVFIEGERVLENPLPSGGELPPYGYVIPRQEFDERLFRAACAAGAMPLQGHTFVGYRNEAGSVAVTVRGESGERTIRGRVLVGADGSASLIALQMRGRPQPKGDRLIALRAYYDGVEMASDAVDLHFHARTFPGYFWIFPMGGARANVGIGMVQQTVPPARIHLRDMMHDLIAHDPVARARLGDANVATKVAGWPLSTYNGRLPLAAERVVLVGDAAGFINPVNGEGIQYAIASGRWAAEAIADSFDRERDVTRSALGGYTQRATHEIGFDLALNRFVIAVAGNRALNPAWIALLRAWCTRAARDPEYLRIAAGVVAGLVPSRRLFEPATRRVSFGETFNALRRARASDVVRTFGATLATGFREPFATLRWFASISEAGVQAAHGRLMRASPA